MASTTNYNWSTPDDTALVKDGASAIRTLGSSIDTTTKALNPSTTLGDIEYRSSTANTNTRLAIGTTGQVLTVSGGVPAWATVTAGGFTLLSTTTLSGTSTTISSISGSYNHLYIQIENFGISAVDKVRLKLNAASSPSASYSSASGTMVTSSTQWELGQARDLTLGQTTGNCAIWVYNYASTTNHKVGTFVCNINDNATGLATFWGFGRYSSNTEITSIEILTGGTASFNNGSVKIYGVK